MAEKAKCWVWMRGNPLKDESYWMSGWTGSEAEKGGIRIEHFDYVVSRVPEWRVSWKEPADLRKAPQIPVDAVWKLTPTD